MGKKYRKNLTSIIMVVALVISSLCGNFGVSQAKSQAVFLKAAKKNLQVGKTYQIKVKKAKGITIKKKTFSKKGAAVKVNKKGKVTAKKEGKATVICKVTYCKKGKKKIVNKKLKCKITVKKAGSTDAGQTDETIEKNPTEKPGISVNPVPEQTGKVVTTGSPSPEQTGAADTTGSPSPEQTGAADATGSPSPEQSDAPDATVKPTPEETEATVPTEKPMPEETEATVPTEKPTPEETEATVPTEKPTPEETETTVPTVKPTPEETDEPETTDSPEATPTASPGSPTEETKAAFELVHKMGLGINLGNTMEAYCANATSTSQLERNWGQPITTQAMITGMKNAGFRSLRIPVSWSSMMSNDGNYTINEALLQRVEEIMNYALQEDMYVIINIHWDGQWWGQFGDADSSVRAKAWARYEAFWTQIADYYKDYSDHLIFESANEELGGRLNDDWTMSGSAQTGTLSTSECYQTMNEINQKFVDIVRSSGGNNATRFLLIAGYDTDIDKTCNSQFQMPTDTIEDHLMVSVHYYSPSTYCIADKPDNSWGYMESWGTESDITAMKTQLSAMKLNFVDKGFPVVIGEYGVTDSYINGSYVRKEGRDVFFKTLCSYAISNGMCPMLWNTGNVYDKSTCAMKNSTEASGYLELCQEAENMDVYVPAEFSGEYVWYGTLQNSSYNQHVKATREESNITVTGNGGCFTLSGVDWDLYTNPVIELSSDGLSGSCYCKFATSYVDQPNWPYVGDADAFYKKNWTFGNTITIDASGKSLSGSQALYFSLNGDDFEGNITIKIKEKS